MTRVIRHIHYHVIQPTSETIALGARLHYLIWTKYFDDAWAQTPLHEKLTWILFLSHTFAILSILMLLSR